MEAWRWKAPARSATAPVNAPRTAGRTTPALDELRRDRRAVDGHEGAGFATTKVVNRVCDELLAGAGFSGDQHRGLAIREQPDGLLNRADGLARADKHVLGRPGCRQGEGLPFCQHLCQDASDVFPTDRFRQVIECTQPYGLDRVGGAGVRGEHGDWRSLVLRTYAAQNFEPIHPRHPQVQKHCVHRLAVRATASAASPEAAQMRAVAEVANDLCEEPRV